MRVVSSLYATPFFRSQPSRRFVVTTLSARGGGPPPRPTPATPSGSHSATENPCNDLGPGDSLGEKRSRRVCCPASLSTLRTSSLCHESRRRVGTCSRPAAPYALHDPSV